MRLIDADELNRIIEESIGELGSVYYTGEMIYAMRMVCQYAIEGAPTIDAVPVIRCKDCKHSEPWYRDRRRCSMWDEEGDLVCVWDDGFCNYAEREKKQ